MKQHYQEHEAERPAHLDIGSQFDFYPQSLCSTRTPAPQGLNETARRVSLIVYADEQQLQFWNQKRAIKREQDSVVVHHCVRVRYFDLNLGDLVVYFTLVGWGQNTPAMNHFCRWCSDCLTGRSVAMMRSIAQPSRLVGVSEPTLNLYEYLVHIL